MFFSSDFLTILGTFVQRRPTHFLILLRFQTFSIWNLSKFWETHARENSQVTKSTHMRHRRWKFNRDTRFCMSHWWNSWPRLFKGWIALSTEKNSFPGDKYYEDQLRYPLDGDLSSGLSTVWTTGAWSRVLTTAPNDFISSPLKLHVKVVNDLPTKCVQNIKKTLSGNVTVNFAR